MKRLFALLFLLCSFAVHAQLPADSTTGKVVYRGAVKLPAGVSQAQAFGRAKSWLAHANTLTSKVPTEDAPAGLLSGEGLAIVRNFHYTYRVRLQVEGAQLRYRLDDFKWYTGNPHDEGTPEEQRDSKMAVGRGLRAKILAELDQKVRAGLAQLPVELAAGL